MPLSPMKVAAHSKVNTMYAWKCRHLRSFSDAQANTTVTDEAISTKVLSNPGMTGSARSGQG